MALLSGTQVRVDVWPAVVGPGEFGADELLLPDVTQPATIRVYGTLVRPTSSVTTAGGFDDTQRVQLMCRSFPWPARSVVGAQGQLYDVVAPPRTRGYAAGTRHAVVELVARARGLAAAPDGRARPA